MTRAPIVCSTASADGTCIGFVQYGGDGPGIVLVQGAMADAYSYRDLASALADDFTVFAVDRRGRGLSPRPFDAAHRIARDVEDIDAVLAATGAERVFGLSSGAVITLQSARTLERITSAAVFEPPFYAEGISRDGIRRIGDDLDRGRDGAALIGALTTAGTAPALLARLPRPLPRLLGAVVLRVDSARRGPHARLRDLLPGVRYDFADVAELDGRIEELGAIRSPVLVLSGTRSPSFLRDAARRLDRILPDSELVVLEGLGHDGPWNAKQGGEPDRVAAELRRFFR